MTIVSNWRYSVKKKAKKKFKRSHLVPALKNSFPLSKKNNTSYSLELDSKEVIQVIKYPNDLIKTIRPCFVVLDRIELKKSPYFKYVANEKNFDKENISKLSKTFNIKRKKNQVNLRSLIADTSMNRTLDKVESCQIETRSKETSNSLPTEIDSNILKRCLILKNENSCSFLNMSSSSDSNLCSGSNSTNNKISNKTVRICNMKHSKKSYDSCQLQRKNKSIQNKSIKCITKEAVIWSENAKTAKDDKFIQNKNIKYSTKEVDIWSESAKTAKHGKTAFVLCDNKGEYKNLDSIIRPCSVILTKINFNSKNINSDLNVRSDDRKLVSPVKKISNNENVTFDSNCFHKISANLIQDIHCSNEDLKFHVNEEDRKFECESKLEFTSKTDNKLVTMWLNTFGKMDGKDHDQKDSKLPICEEKENLIHPCSVMLKNYNLKNTSLSQNDALNLQFTEYRSEKNIKINEIINLTENSGESNHLTYSCIAKHTCDQCGKILLNVKALYYHLCHGKKKRGFFCMLCEKTFDFYRLFAKHKCFRKTQTILSCSKLLKHRRTIKYSKKSHTYDSLKILPSSNQFSESHSNVTRALSCKTSKTPGNFGGKEYSYPVSKMREKTIRIKSIFIKDISCASTSKA